MELAERKQKILSAVVENFIKTGEPVGSKTLIDETDLKVSSATVRNDMADLTQKGYLVQPHTSAGRIPTQQGYRYYVDNLMKIVAVSQRGRELVEDKLYRNAESPENILKSAADLLSELTGLTAVATAPNSAESRIHKISFVQTGSHTAMTVVIASNGIIKNQLFRCEFIITPEILEVFDKALNELFDGVRLSSINRPFIQTAAARFGELSLFMPSVLTAIKDAADKANEVGIFLSGQTKPLFMQNVNFLAARNVIELLSRKGESCRCSYKPADRYFGKYRYRKQPHRTCVQLGNFFKLQRKRYTVRYACRNSSDTNGLRQSDFDYRMYKRMCK